MPSASAMTSGSSSGQTACWVNGCHTCRRSAATRSRVVRRITGASSQRARPTLAVVVSSLADMVRQHSDLPPADVERLHALVADWQLLADLSFADLVLHVPLRADHPA